MVATEEDFPGARVLINTSGAPVGWFLELHAHPQLQEYELHAHYAHPVQDQPG